MAKTKYTEARTEIGQVVDKLFNSFPDRLIHIKRSDVLLVEKDSPKSTYKAKTRLLNGFYRMLTAKKIIIEVWKQEWELLRDHPAEKALLLYRELYKIDINDKTKDYKLMKFDLTDFKKLVEKTGLNGETTDQFFAKVIA
jgi:hypothetical protein